MRPIAVFDTNILVSACLAEVHWFEAHGIGKKKMRIKRYLD